MESTPVAASESPVAEPSIDSPRRASGRCWRVYAFRSIGWLFIALVLALSLREGLRLRRWAFDVTDPIRFLSDIYRGCYWGLTASGPEGYLNQYDKMEPQLPDREDSRWVPWLDYAPLRLLVMRQWGAWQRVHYPPEANRSLLDAWQHGYEFNEPVLRFNTGMELFAAFCAFFLTRHWVIRGNGGKPRRHFDGVWQGVVAALLIWFGPDVLLSAHGWITWDFWVVPWFLCTALLASLDWWFAAGLAMSIGAMFKGQQLFVAPIFIIWPLVEGRLGPVLRLLCGLTFGIAILASGWLVTYLPADPLNKARQVQEYTQVSDYPPNLFAIPRVFDLPAAIWIAEMILITAAVPWLLRVLSPAAPPPQSSRLKAVLHSRWMWIAAGALLIAASFYWPFLLKDNREYWGYGLLGGAALAAAALLLRPRKQPYVLAAAAGGGLLLCILLFHGGIGWAKCTFEYGTIHWPYMTQGPASNVPSVFELRFGWPHVASETAFTLPAIQRHWPQFITGRQWWPACDLDVSAKTLFDSIFVFFLLLSGVAVGLQARRNDRRMLVALATPWIMFFLWPVQIHERYLLFASGAAVCCIGNSVGTCLLGILVTLFSTILHLDVMTRFSSGVDAFGRNLSDAFPALFSPECGQTIRNYLQGTHPDMAWGILAVGLAFVYLSLTPSPRALQNRRPVSSPSPCTQGEGRGGGS
ncbi:MAG: hypothetical protein ABSH08_03475 [Tepidisphaeraceae bacterium]|jgi:hypothetical protein